MNEIVICKGEPLKSASGDLSCHTMNVNRVRHWSIRKEGSLCYIVDPEGRRVSEGFHSFEAFRCPGDGMPIFMGRLGAMKYILRISPDTGLLSRGEQPGFHSLDWVARLDCLVCRIGAMKYIFDLARAAPAHERGYHEIRKLPHEAFLGEIGAEEEIIHFFGETTPEVTPLALSYLPDCHRGPPDSKPMRSSSSTKPPAPRDQQEKQG